MGAPGHFERTQEPAMEPVTLEEAKAHAVVQHAAHDGLIESYIAAARAHVEKKGLALIDQTWVATFDAWDAKGLKLRPHPVQSIAEVRVWDGSAMAPQASVDFVLRKGRPALLTLAWGATPPIPTERNVAGIEVEFVAGFGATAANVPDDIRLAMKQLVAHWYENREPTAASQNLSVVGKIAHQVDELLSPYRNLRLA